MARKKPQSEQLLEVAGARHQRRGARARALGATVQALRDVGALERVDDALVDGARAAAQLVDAALADPDESRFVVRALVGEYREWLRDLRALNHADAGAHPLDHLLAALGDTPDP